MVSHTNIISAEQFTVEELRAAVLEGRGELGPALALNLLALKDYAEKEADMQRLLQTEAASPRLRLTAAQSLGQLTSGTAQAALLAALDTSDPAVRRAVVAALGRAGGRDVIERVRQIDRSTLGGAALTHMARAAFRLNMDGFDLPATRTLTLLDPAQFEMQPFT